VKETGSVGLLIMKKSKSVKNSKAVFEAVDGLTEKSIYFIASF